MSAAWWILAGAWAVDTLVGGFDWHEPLIALLCVIIAIDEGAS